MWWRVHGSATAAILAWRFPLSKKRRGSKLVALSNLLNHAKRSFFVKIPDAFVPSRKTNDSTAKARHCQNTRPQHFPLTSCRVDSAIPDVTRCFFVIIDPAGTCCCRLQVHLCKRSKVPAACACLCFRGVPFIDKGEKKN